LLCQRSHVGGILPLHELPLRTIHFPSASLSGGYTLFMEPPTTVGLANFSFEEFVSFLFDHDVPSESKEYDPWNFHVEVEFDAKKICVYYVQLFRQPEFLLSRFTKPQLEEGFWAIQGPNLDCSVSRIIHDSDQPLSIQGKCIGSMADLFKHLFAKEPLDSSVQMWWDSLCYDWQCGNRNRESGGEDLKLQDKNKKHTLLRQLGLRCCRRQFISSSSPEPC
jgi:hypothetical protein